MTTTITCQVLDKAYRIPETGTLLWTVDYKFCDIIHEGTYIKDVLPSGLDLLKMALLQERWGYRVAMALSN